MEVILNDYSLDEQFDNIEEFVDSLVNSTFLALGYLENKSSVLLKSYNTYDDKICESISVYDFLSSQDFMGFPEAQKLRSVLSKLVAEPFWNDNSKTDKKATYKCDKIGVFGGDDSNCFSEALERDKIILSFENSDYKIEKILISKDGTDYQLYNLYDENSAAKNLFLLNQIGFVEFLQQGLRGVDIDFYLHGSKYYADECYERKELSKKDVLSIKEDFNMFIKGKMQGNMLDRLSDSIKYKELTYNEFRTSLSGKREFRIYYYIDGRKWVFFDSIIKKTETTPEHVKKQTYELIKKYRTEKT